MALCRTGYSFKTAVGLIDEVVPRLAELGWPAAPITDRVSTFGYVGWDKACAEAGIKPVFGVELAAVPALRQKNPPADYWTFLAIDSLPPLHELINTATMTREKFPALSYVQALEALNNDMIVIAGERLLLDAEHAPAAPFEDFFISLGPHTPKGLYEQARRRDFRFVACSENNYLNPGDREFYRVALGRHANLQSYPQHLLDDQEWCAATEWFVDRDNQAMAIANRNDILQLCHAKLDKARFFQPEHQQSLAELCRAGASRLHIDLRNPVYAARLDRELKLIEEKRFEDYFYILADVVSYARERMVVGPARGSSCGSLVCYLLGITTVDPIPYGLLIERFIDINRKDLPDIDVDFSDERRHLVFEYMEKKFGREHVARLGTVGLFRTKSALNQAGQVLKVPQWKLDRMAEGLHDRQAGDERVHMVLADAFTAADGVGRQLLDEHPEMTIASRLEGHPQHSSQHAAGMLLTEGAITDYVAVDGRTGCAMIDKYDAEKLNLLKIDALGLTQLSIFERCLELIDKPVGWLERIPLDDQAAFDILNHRRFSGVFQFMGQTLQRLVMEFSVESLDDMVAATALARPGPLDNAPTWIKRRRGEEEVTTVHPAFTEITRETFGIPVYQETVMRTVREIGAMSWEDTSAIRKAISATKGDEFFSHYLIKFVDGARLNGIDSNAANEIWNQIRKFGSYAFNKSHAVAYSIISYWCCWLKAHYPLEFAAATLDAEKDPVRQIELLRELDAEGIGYVPVDAELSSARWQVAERDGRSILVGPLTSIKGIGPAFLNEILDARKKGEPLRKALADKLQRAQTPIDDLWPIKTAYHRLAPDPTQFNITGEIIPIRQCSPGDKVTVVGVATKMTMADSGLKLWLRDDTGDIFCKVNQRRYHKTGKRILEQGERGKAIWVVDGFVPDKFRMIDVKFARYIGSLDEAVEWRTNKTDTEAAA